MSELLIAIGIAAVAFVATNVENLIVLLGFLAAAPGRAPAVGLGYLLSVGVVVAASWGIGEALNELDPRHLRWLGLLPLGAGVYAAVQLLRGGTIVPEGEQGGSLALWGVFGISLVNSVDSLVVFGPLFGETKGRDLVAMVVAIGAMACLTVLAARWLVGHPQLGAWLRRYAPLAVPVLLIAVGAYILVDTPTDLEGR